MLLNTYKQKNQKASSLPEFFRIVVQQTLKRYFSTSNHIKYQPLEIRYNTTMNILWCYLQSLDLKRKNLFYQTLETTLAFNPEITTLPETIDPLEKYPSLRKLYRPLASTHT